MNLLPGRMETTAFAFRGYNVTNLGRTPELLEHARYGPTIAAFLNDASAVATTHLDRPVDLLRRVHFRQETTDLTTYAEDLAMLMAVELAQMKLLEQHFNVKFGDARLAFGYSLGEAIALVAAEVFEMEHMLRAPLAVADDLVELGRDVSMGVLFSRGRALDEGPVKRLCLELSQEGRGTIGISTHLSPNAMLLLGQQDTVERFQKAMRDVLPDHAHLRRNQHRWPPMHTPITWQRGIPNRGAVLLETLPGGFQAPPLTILSGVASDAVYNEHNSRELLHRWVDHPQRLWSLINRTLAAGIETIIHVGPDPNLVPATFHRLSEDVIGQLNGYWPGSLGRRAVSHLVRRPWLAQLLPSSAALLRAPRVQHVILEDWLLEQG